MDEKSKETRNKSWMTPRALSVWFVILTTVVFIAVLSAGCVPSLLANYLALPAFALFISICSVFSIFLTIGFIRWLCSWHNFKRFLFVLACLVTFILLFYAEEDWRGKHNWDQFKHDWEARGERLDAASAIPPAVPDDQNLSLAPVFDAVNKLMNEKWRAQHRNPQQGRDGDQREWDTNLVNRLEMPLSENGEDPTNGFGDWRKSTVSDLGAWQQYYRQLAVKTNEFPVPLQPQTPAPDVLLALSPYDAAIEELRVAAQLPDSRFPISYDMEPPAVILLPHLAGLKRSSRVLQLRALAELQNGQSEKALEDVKLILRLSESIRTEPFLISHLVRIAIVNIALQPVWEGLVAHQWSDAQLGGLDGELAKVDLLADYHTAMRGELVLCEIGNIEYLRRYPERTPDMSGEGGGDFSSHISGWTIWKAIPNGWFYQNELNCAQPMLEYYLPMADVNQRMVRPGDVRRADSTVTSKLEHRNPYNVFARLVLPALGIAVKKSASGQESVDLARTAVALERYRLVHGSYPESLDALVPQFIAKLPHDIINGQPLHYRQTADGQFVLYSVGWNETDDGGMVVLNKGSSSTVDINRGDWVWSSSASKNWVYKRPKLQP
jgi:hypothetical protein